MNHTKKKLAKENSKENLDEQNTKETKQSHENKRLEKWQIGRKRFP